MREDILRSWKSEEKANESTKRNPEILDIFMMCWKALRGEARRRGFGRCWGAENGMESA